MKLEDLKIEDEELLQNIKKLIQGEGDKVRTEYSKKNKELQSELDKYKPKDEPKDEKDSIIEELKKQVESLMADRKISAIEKSLKDNNLPKGFSKYLIGSENIDDDIKGLKDMFKEQLSDYVPSNKNAQVKTFTKEEFDNMSFDEQCALAESNPTLYDSLSK